MKGGIMNPMMGGMGTMNPMMNPMMGGMGGAGMGMGGAGMGMGGAGMGMGGAGMGMGMGMNRGGMQQRPCSSVNALL